MLVAVNVSDDLLLQLVLVGGINDALWVAALDIEEDVAAAVRDSAGLAPVDFAEVVAVGVLLSDGVAEVTHDGHGNAAAVGEV